MWFRFLGISSLVAFALASGLALGKGPKDTTPAEADFRDVSGDRIQSDGLGLYVEDRTGACTASVVHNNGLYFLRTVGPTCTRTRSMKLDFTDRVETGCPGLAPIPDPAGGLPLNICGLNDVPDVRFIADTLFQDTTSDTPLILYFSMKTNGDFVGAQSFQLEFVGNVPVTNGDASFRELTADSMAVAELYLNEPQGKKTVKVILGHYRMPFQLTVTKTP